MVLIYFIENLTKFPQHPFSFPGFLFSQTTTDVKCIINLVSNFHFSAGSYFSSFLVLSVFQNKCVLFKNY